MDRDCQKVWAVLEAHRGAQKVIARRVLVAACAPLDDRAVRDAIHELRTVYAKPIVGRPSGGYYVATSRAEVQQYLADIDSRIRELSENGKALLRAFPDAQQGSLF